MARGLEKLNRAYVALILVTVFCILTLAILSLWGQSSELNLMKPEPQLDLLDQNLGLTETELKPTSVSVTLTWTEQLQADAEIIWQVSKRKRLAAIERLGSQFANQTWGESGNAIFWDFFTPSYTCPRPVERIGRLGDGGKWVCGFSHIAATKPRCVVYSFGIGSEITFEAELLARSNCIVRMFDHTINLDFGPAADLVRLYPNRAILYKIGIGVSNDDKFSTLKTQMERFGDTFIDILKIDAEGAEFEALDEIIKEFPDKLPFGQLQIEVHVYAIKGNPFELLAGWFDRLETAGLRAFFSEPNQIPMLRGKTSHIAYMEYAFLNCKMDLNYFY